MFYLYSKHEKQWKQNGQTQNDMMLMFCAQQSQQWRRKKNEKKLYFEFAFDRKIKVIIEFVIEFAFFSNFVSKIKKKKTL